MSKKSILKLVTVIMVIGIAFSLSLGSVIGGNDLSVQSQATVTADPITKTPLPLVPEQWLAMVAKNAVLIQDVTSTPSVIID